MTTENPSAGNSAVVSAPAGARAPATPAPPSWPWRRGALMLAGAAQLITISALVGPDHLPLTWAGLLLAIAPAPLAAAAAFAPSPWSRLGAAAAVVAMAAGLGGAITHTGLFFVPALVVEIVASAKLWAERGQEPNASQAPTKTSTAPAATNSLSADRPQRP
jgi:hypothetical protein